MGEIRKKPVANLNIEKVEEMKRMFIPTNLR